MDNLNPYASPNSSAHSPRVKSRGRGQLILAILITGIGPIFTAALSNLIIGIYNDCNTLNCRMAYAKDGVIHGTIAGALMLVLIVVLPSRLRVFAAIVLLTIWSIAISRYYYLEDLKY